MDLGLNNKKALVVGASRGLGAAIARALAAEGATVVAAARSVDKIEAWIAELPADVRSRVSALKLDTGDIAQIDAAADKLLTEGGVDVLVNNTGGPPPGVAKDVKRDAWLTQFQSMAANLFHLTQRLLPRMQEKKWGRIITVASSGIEQPIPNLALSNGIRSAVLGWSKTLANEVAQDGVTVNMVLPGRIQTERIGQLDQANAERLNVSIDKIAQSAMAQIPAGRYGTPEEFANVVAFLAGEPASYVTGTKIRIDGGATRSV